MAVAMIRRWRAGDRSRFVWSMTAGAVMFTAPGVAPPIAIDAQERPKELVRVTASMTRLAKCSWRVSVVPAEHRVLREARRLWRSPTRTRS